MHTTTNACDWCYLYTAVGNSNKLYAYYILYTDIQICNDFHDVSVTFITMYIKHVGTPIMHAKCMY